MTIAASTPKGATLQGSSAGKLPWEPMKLLPIGTVAALLEAATGSVSDGGGMQPNMRVGP